MFPNWNERIAYAPDDGAGSAAADGGEGAGAEGAAEGAAAEGQGDNGTLLSGDKAGAGSEGKDGAEGVEGKAEGDGEGDGKDADPSQQVPEDGKYEFEMPEGVELDAALAEKAAPILKEQNITRAQANALAKLVAEDRKAQFEKWSETQENWVKQAKTDKEFGGDKFDASIKGARSVLEKFGTPELREYLTASGGGNHPEMIRFMARVGNAISDDKPVGSETPAGSKQKDAAEILYGSSES
jgi:hypothetical protein